LAVSDSRGQIGLIDPETGRTVTTLAHPNQTHFAAKIAFTPDGRYLATLSNNGREVVHIWDLLTLRKELRTRGLDWSDSPLPGQNADDFEPRLESPHHGKVALAVRCVSDERFQQLEAAQQARRATDAAANSEIGAARAAIRRSLELKPEDAWTCNTLAWLLATGPVSLRDIERSVQLAQFASTKDPTQATYANTLGIALYRAARYPEAVTALESSLVRNAAHDQPFDLFFLSMCQARLGDPDKARETFDRARKLVDEHTSKFSLTALNELHQFAREAELELLSAGPD
jgi:Tfp pilus assembly protein PilF